MSRSLLRSSAFAGAATLAVITPAGARQVRQQSIILSAAWSRPTPPAAPAGAGYLTITNNGARPDRLVGGSSPVVRDVQIHEMRLEGGVARMHPVEGGLVIPAHGSVTLAPGGYHVMLIGPKRRFTLGETVPATLRFARAGALNISFSVRTDAPSEVR